MRLIIRQAAECAALAALLTIFCAVALASRGPATDHPADRNPTADASRATN